MAEDLAAAQKRVLLAQMAQAGSAATAAYQQGQEAIAQQKQQALSSAVGASSQAGGVNDVGGLLDRRIASMQQGQQTRLGDMAQRGQAYAADLGLASQGNVARRSEIDRTVATRRSELEREIASKRADMVSQLAMRKMEIEAKRQQAEEDRAIAVAESQADRYAKHALAREEAEAKPVTPEDQAARLKAERYLADPDGTKEQYAEARAKAAQAKQAMDTSPATLAEARETLGLDDKVADSVVKRQALLAVYPVEVVDALMPLSPYAGRTASASATVKGARRPGIMEQDAKSRA